MFTVNQTITSLIHPLMTNAQHRLPVAHQRAQRAGVAHLHQAAQEAATKSGFSKDALLVHSRAGALYVAIDHSEAGDALADNEFGAAVSKIPPGVKPVDAYAAERPNPVLRTAMAGVHKEASSIYRHTLRQEMGL